MSGRTSPSIEAFRALDVDLVLTAHYPIYEGPAAAAFLDESERYTREIDDVLTDLLAHADGGLTTLELVREAGARLGPWGPGALDYAVFPVTGNLERMRDAGLVREELGRRGRRRWSRVSGA